MGLLLLVFPHPAGTVDVMVPERHDNTPAGRVGKMAKSMTEQVTGSAAQALDAAGERARHAAEQVGEVAVRIGAALRPTWRGRIHRVAAMIAPLAGVPLLLSIEQGTAQVAAAVFVLGLTICFGTSAFYHACPREGRALEWLQRADHAGIFILIAATFTPVCFAITSGGAQVALLCGVWSVALCGLVLKLARRAWRLTTALYLVLGWMALPMLPWIYSRFGLEVVALLFIGGVLYTVGATLFLSRRPFREARRFGFHEVWHSFTVAAAASHFAAVATLLA